MRTKLLVTLLTIALLAPPSNLIGVGKNDAALENYKSSKSIEQNIDLDEIREEYGFKKGESLDDLPTFSEQESIPAVAAQTAEKIIETGRKYIGVPYVFGSPSGYTKTFDCSTFTQYLYGLNGIKLPRVSRDQAKLGKYVEKENLQPGDLLFFYWPGRFESNKIVGHVGIYMGKGYMIHSAPDTPVTTDGVQIMDLNDKENPFREFYLGAKRVE